MIILHLDHPTINVEDNEPIVMAQPSTRTKSNNLNGSEINIGDNIIIPRDIKIEAITMSITRNGKKITLKKNVFNIVREKKWYHLPKNNKINFLSTKSGDTIGNHSVILTNKKETLNLIHEAHDRSLYSEGALKAAKWLINKKPGLYSMKNVLNFK